ncbi:hypothetical protein BaRGS_00038191, partial [Batillaria attramentaria]
TDFWKRVSTGLMHHCPQVSPHVWWSKQCAFTDKVFLGLKYHIYNGCKKLRITYSISLKLLVLGYCLKH